MKSIAQMVDQCEGLIGTTDASDWESSFLQLLVERQRDHRPLSEKQAEILDRIWRKHFA